MSRVCEFLFGSGHARRRLIGLSLILGLSLGSTQAAVETPSQFFGFKPGQTGELVRYPVVLDYLQSLAAGSDRVIYEEVGKTTMGNPFGLITVSSPENLKNLDRILEINQRLADPRGLSEDEAAALIAEGKPVYYLYATIHSTEVSNIAATTEIAYQLASGDSPEIKQILHDAVVLIEPSQNPDGQYWVVDHWYKTAGTDYQRVYPDLYHKYTGHDDNRDWFMFTQIETRLNLGIQARYRPVISHDMHQMGNRGARIFVPPFDDPFDRNMHPLLQIEQATVGQAMAEALFAAGKEGINWGARYDMWSPARQFMIYKGQPRILTEIARSNLADPQVSKDGSPLGPQEISRDFPVPYSQDTWTLQQQVDYGVIAAMAGIKHVARYGKEFMTNFYHVQKSWVTRTAKPYAFVVSAEQRDPYATYEMLEIMETAEVEIERADEAFTADGTTYPAGSYVIRTAQPYGAFAKTMLERQDYPDLKVFPGGPPKRPYDATGQTLWMLMGVDVAEIEAPFEASLDLVEQVAPVPQPPPAATAGFYLIGPESYGVFKVVSALQAADVPAVRTAEATTVAGKSFAPGTLMFPINPETQSIVTTATSSWGLPVVAATALPGVDGFALKPDTRVGLYRSANIMPGGWLMWVFDQYDVNYRVVSADDFTGDLNDRYDVIVMPSGLSKQRVIKGLDQTKNDPAEWGWAAGIGEEGWIKLRQWVHDGGTLLAIGSASETARDLLDLPIEPALPAPERNYGDEETHAEEEMVSAAGAAQKLKDTFMSPASLMYTLRDEVADPTSLFYCPGSLLDNLFDPTQPVAWGMPAQWPVFFIRDQAYRLRPSFDIQAEVVSKYPSSDILQSGWLLGEDYLKDQANVVSFEVGEGFVVTFGTQVDFRAQARATTKMVFNAIYHGPSTAIPAADVATVLAP
ncbi:M14 family zinc carboxypeptidase [Synoicihabitans lomoniglobus]|uniref:M14 family zinc carboxypeptidase n=1 Tax=Synoicihabitans lomoniglobus TaxID=2909285 RepID=A0AAF0CQ54_9BACT|nr:hypothetical protein [Opitutaceae bacterium LMO-M01]WED65994.1 M14 family zinc carboxypeptidase [Opitutaceae bacterium LMO-M01]